MGERLGLAADEALAIVTGLRESLPSAFERTKSDVPADLRKAADRMTDGIVAHIEGGWHPALPRDPALDLPSTPQGT